MVERPLMVQWVIGSFPHGGPIELFPIPPVFHDWCIKGCICYLLCGMVHIKEPLLLIRKSTPCGGISVFYDFYINHKYFINSDVVFTFHLALMNDHLLIYCIKC